MIRKAREFATPALGERGRRIMQAGTWSLVSKAATAANLFVAVPFVLAALGPARFGAWATLVSLIVFSGFLDFGLSNGAMNLIAGAHGRSAECEARSILREARAALLKVAAALTVVAALGFWLVPWQRLLGLDVSLAGESLAAVAILIATIILSVPLNLANRAQLAIGRGERTFQWQTAGQLGALLVTIGLASQHADLPALTAAAVATPLLAGAANTLLFWRGMATTRNHENDPAPPIDSRRLQRSIGREGIAFFGLHLAAALAFSADLPLISLFSGSAQAGTYAIGQRMFSVVPLCLGLVWAPLWPIYRHALAAGDHAWVRRTIRRSLAGALGFSLLVAPLLAVGFQPIVEAWVRAPVVIPGLLLAGFAAWSVVEAVGTSLSTFLNAASVLRYQLATALVFSTTCVSGKAWVIWNGHIDLIPWVTVMTYILSVIVPAIFMFPRLLASTFKRAY